MSLPAGTVWEVRTNGNDTNGGGFVAGAAGTDYSQQNTKNSGASDKSTTDAVTAASTTVTSATANFGATIVGNIIYLSGGTGSLTGAWYYVSARASATSITIDRNPGASTGVTMNIGGALKTIGQLATNWVASNKAFIKADGTYTPTATITFTPTSAPPDTPANLLIGYTTTRTDRGQATIQATTNSGITLLSLPAGYWLRNLILDCNNLATSIGILGGNYLHTDNCVVKNFTTAGIRLTANTNSIHNTEITGGGAAATAAIDYATFQNNYITYCYIHNNQCPGTANPINNGGCGIIGNIFANNSGASSDGAQIRYGYYVIGNVFYNNGRDGLRVAVEYSGIATIIRNNIFVSNAGYGINQTTTPANAAQPQWDFNAYYNNTSGARNNMDSTSTTATISDGVSPYSYVGNVTLTGVPFTNAGAGDYSLNNTAGQGAACRAAGFAGTFIGGLSVGYQDMGAIQHKDPASSGTTNIFILDD